MNNKYKITIEYLGNDFCGWQRQPNALSIQEVIEQAIYKFSKETVSVTAAGRTDAGVHAYGQVASFCLDSKYSENKIIESINFFCKPYPVGVIECISVDADFDARFSAKQRHYVYKILNRKGINIIEVGKKWWIRDYLDIELMRQAGSCLVGQHDFSSFRASECQAKSAVKTIDKIEIIAIADTIEIHVSALSFLHHMVRNIVGNLVKIGRQHWPAIKIQEILDCKDRSKAGPTAPAHGLYFLQVDY